MSQRRPGLSRVAFRRVGEPPSSGSGGITELTGDGSAGPGTGSQAFIILGPGAARVAVLLGLGTAATHPAGDFLQTADNLSDVASASTARVNLAVAIGATWTVGVCRVYAVRPDGNDANVGFADPASSSAADYATACAAAGAVGVAKATIAGLMAILPRWGAGRTAEIVFLGNNTYVGALFVGVDGYSNGGLPTVRGTITDATAGCVAFDGSVADCTSIGMTTAAGMNAAGYNPVAAFSTTVIKCLKVGAAAPGFGAEPAIPLGANIRFDAATTTAALRNVRRWVGKVSGGDTLTLNAVLPAVPVGTDTFYIEMASVTLSTAQGWSTAANNLGTTLQTAQIAGLNFSVALQTEHGNWRFAGCSGAAWVFVDGVTNVGSSYTHPVRSLLAVGGHRLTGSWTTTSQRIIALQSILTVGTQTHTALRGFVCTPAMVCAAGLAFNSCPLGPSAISIGLNGTFVGIPTRIIGPSGNSGLRLFSSQLNVAQLEIINMGALPAVQFAGENSVFACGDGLTNASFVSITGTTGNTGYGFDFYLGKNSLLVVNLSAASGVPSVTGSLGDVRTSANQAATWATVQAGYLDAANNRVFSNFDGGIAGIGPLGSLFFAGKLFGGAGAVQSFPLMTFLEVGNNAVDPQFPVSARLVLQLRVGAVFNTMTQAVTVTLMKNGVATGQVATIPAGSTAVVVSAGGSPAYVGYVASDRLSLRLDSAGPDIGNAITLAAGAEFPI